MKKLLSLIVGFLLFLVLLSVVVDKAQKPRLTNEQIAGAVPLGASPMQVMAFLDSKHIEHFGYEVNQDKKRYITARSRGSNWSIVREDHVVIFRFDDADHLIAKEPHVWLTGP